MSIALRILAYAWAAPNTLMAITIGLLLAGRFQLVDGVVEIHGPRVRYLLDRLPVPALAMTVGHVVFGQTEAALDITRRHERVHVRQYERWGPFFIPAYFVASAYMSLKGETPIAKTRSRSKPMRLMILTHDVDSRHGGLDPHQATSQHVSSQSLITWARTIGVRWNRRVDVG